MNQSHQSIEKHSDTKDKPRDLPDLPCDNEKPETAWNSHIKRNNSFIVKLFHGQLMSKVTCDACRKVSCIKFLLSLYVLPVFQQGSMKCDLFN